MNLLNEWQETLVRSGITENLLILMIIVSAIVCVLTFREFLSWYLKTSQMKRELYHLRQTLSEMNKELKGFRAETKAYFPIASQNSFSSTEKTPPPQGFPINH